MEKVDIDIELFVKDVKSGVKVSDIIAKFNISKTTYYRLKNKFVKKSSPKYKNKDWLKKEYLLKNRTAQDIANEFSVSKRTILYHVKKFGLKKDKESITQNIRKSSKFLEDDFQEIRRKSLIEKYGVEHPHASNDIREKYTRTMNDRYGVATPLASEALLEKKKETMMKRHGVESPLQSKAICDKMIKTRRERYSIELTKNNLSDKKHIRTFLGKDLKLIANESEVGYTTITSFLRDKESISADEFLSFLDGIRNGKTSLELNVEKEFGLNFFNKKVLDYRPDFKINENIYLNVDGLYWHSEVIQPDKEYHFNMRKDFEKSGLRIIQIREDEVYQKREIVKSIISNISNSTERKIGARKCKVKIVNQSEASSFLNKSHLMGSVNAKHIGLYFQDELVSLISWKEFNDKIKIERFCSSLNTIVQGGISRLLKEVERSTSNKDIHYWVDLRYGTGLHLLDKGFFIERETLGWKWTDFKNTYNRLKCRANMDYRKLSQKEYSEELGWYKIYDAGQRLLIKRRVQNGC